MPTLTIQLPGFPPVEHILRDEMMTIGRMKGNTIALDDASVSVSHAKITRKGAEFFLKDLNSTNGTMINGQSINEARLKDGDQLKFGEVIALFHADLSVGAAVSAPNPAPAALSDNLATAFVTKRLVTQAPQSSPYPPSSSSFAQTAQIPRVRKQRPAWLIPVLGGGVVLAVVVIGGLKFFGDSRPAAAVPSKPAPVVKIPASVPGESKGLAGLKKALKAVAPVERRRAAKAFHALGAGAKDALPELRNALKDADADVRMWAALALINNKSYDRSAIPILVQVLRHDNPMLRQVSCLSLALIPYEGADKETVVAALADTANKDGDEEVRQAAISALKIIAPEVIAGGK